MRDVESGAQLLQHHLPAHSCTHGRLSETHVRAVPKGDGSVACAGARLVPSIHTG